MENNKQQTVVQLIIQALDIECKSRGMNVNWDMYLEMEKEQMIEFAKEVYISRHNGIQERLSNIANDIYNETYGGGLEC